MSKSEQKKRVRSANFSEAEENLLLRLVLNRKHIIECKATDTQRNEDKHHAWDEVTAEFNANCLNAVRTSVVLKKKYENIKKSIRQAASKERMSRKTTGGGPGPIDWKPKSEELAELRDVIALSVDGLQTMFDDDDDRDENTDATMEELAAANNLVKDTSQDAYEVEYLEETRITLADDMDMLTEPNQTMNTALQAVGNVVASSSNPSSVGDPVEVVAIAGTSQGTNADQRPKMDKWESYSPAMLKRPTSSILKTKRKTSSVAELDLKKKLLERDQEMMEEVHRFEVQKRKVELEAAHISLQTYKIKLQSQQLRYQQMREEHALRMKLLRFTYENNTGKQVSSSGSDSD